MEKVVVFEFKPTGHRLYFIRSVMQALLDLKVHPILAVPAWMPSRTEFQVNLGELESAIEIRHIPLPASYSSRISHYENIGATIASDTVFKAADRIYLPSGGGVAQLIGLKSFWCRDRHIVQVMKKTEILLLGGNHGYPAGFKRSIHDHASRILVRPHLWRKLFHLDPYQFDFLARQAPGLWNLMPDPVEPASDHNLIRSRELLGIASDGICLGCVGSFDASKGSDLLLAAFKDAIPRLPHDSFLLLAGSLDTMTKNLLATTYQSLVSAGRIVVMDRFLSHQAFNAAINAMNIVCLPYRNAYKSSGVFLHAVSAGKRLITSRDGWLGRMMQILRLGECVDVLNHKQLMGAIVRAVDAPLALDALQTIRKQRFLQYHSHENFRATWTSLLRDEMGLPQAAGLRSWEWVTEDTVTPANSHRIMASRAQGAN